MRRPLTVLFAILAIQGIAYANEPACQASISGHSAAFFIENRIGEGRVTWFKQTSPPGDVEYMWTVTPGHRRDDGTLEQSNMMFGFVLAQRTGSVETQGTLEELFKQALPVLLKNGNERIPEAKIKIAPFRNGVIIGTNDPATFRRVFSNRPTSARIDAFLPAAGQDYSCITKIDYE